jgi:hypothetical protein
MFLQQWTTPGALNTLNSRSCPLPQTKWHGSWAICPRLCPTSVNRAGMCIHAVRLAGLSPDTCPIPGTPK